MAAAIAASDKAFGWLSAVAKLLKHDTATNAPHSEKILRTMRDPDSGYQHSLTHVKSSLAECRPHPGAYG
jgi:hypothetical protein